MFERFDEYEYYVTALLCVLALLGMGTTLTASAFREVARRPRSIGLIAFTQLIVGPLLAVGLARVFGVSSGIAVGMLLVTALPGGLFSNVFALLSRSHVALSISATAVCTLGSLITTTLVLKMFGSAHFPEEFEMPVWHVIREITLGLLLPLAAGMGMRRRFPKQAKPIGKACIHAATALLAFYILAAFQSGRLDMSAYGWKTHAAIIALDLLQIAACGVLSWPFRVTALEMFTGQIEVVIRNVHLGLLLKASLFPAVAGSNDQIGSDIIFALLYYGGASVVTGIIMSIVRRTELRVMGDRHPAPPPPELRDG